MHVLMLLASSIFPAGQSWQLVEPYLVEILPMLHLTHVVEPLSILNVDGGQSLHDRLPLTLLKVPGLHGWHLVDPVLAE